MITVKKILRMLLVTLILLSLTPALMTNVESQELPREQTVVVGLAAGTRVVRLPECAIALLHTLFRPGSESVLSGKEVLIASAAVSPLQALQIGS